MKKDKKLIPMWVCGCGYNNHPKLVERFGTCRGCGKTLDPKAKYKYEMYCRLHMWSKKNKGRKI